MDNCIICLESNEDNFSRISTLSSEWIEGNIQRIIEKHLWWWHLEPPCQSKGLVHWICRKCWQEISTFHDFYCKVEMVHRYYQPNLSCLEQPSFAEQESAVLNHEIELNVYSPKDLDKGSPGKQDRNTKLFEIDTTMVKSEFGDDTNESKDKQQESLYVDNPICLDALNIHNNEDCNYEKPLDIILNNRIKKENTTKKKIREYKSKKSSKKKNKKQDIKMEICKQNNEFLAQYEFKLICEICSVCLNNFDSVKTHFREEHKITAYVLCCNRKFYRRSVLVDHLRVHQNPSHFKCVHCNKCLSNRTCYEKHIQLHTQSKELQEKTFCCDECGKSFLKKASYDRHLLSHVPEEEKKFQCDECNKKFAALYLVRQHKAFTHLNKYAKICDICGKTFRERIYFMRHMDEHKGTPIAKWPCDLCSAELSNKYHLNRHKKLMHSEENLKEQNCPHCPKISPNMHAHKLHVRYAHTLERKHACQLCDKKFRRPLELKEHLSTHTGEPLYTCPHCLKTFISSGNLHKHRKNSHPKEFEAARLKKYVGRHKKESFCTTNNVNINDDLIDCVFNIKV